MLVDKGNYGTSAAYMLEIARANLKNDSPLDTLQTPDHSRVSSLRPANGRSSTTGPSHSTAAGNSHSHPASQSHSAPESRGSTGSLLWHWFGRGGELLEGADGLTGNAEKIARHLRRATGLVVHHLPHGDLRQVIRKSRVVVGKFGRVAKKLGSGIETAQILYKLAQNVHTSHPRMVRIIDSDEAWSNKSAKLGSEFAAVSLRTITQIGLAPVHDVTQLARTGAAIAGFDVSHPTFGTHSASDPRSFLSWQAVNFFDSRLNYLSEVIYDGDTIYVFLHAHIPHE